MPVYQDERLKQFRETGLMTFLRYPAFKDVFASLEKPQDKCLAVFIYFSGSRPGELLDITRGDFVVEGPYIRVTIPVLKRSRHGAIDKRRRMVDFPMKFDEVKYFWDQIKSYPNEFYTFGWLRNYANPRAYILNHLKMPAYYLRHNYFSLMGLGGASREDLKVAKGAKDVRSVDCYIHLSEEQRAKHVKYFSKEISK